MRTIFVYLITYSEFYKIALSKRKMFAVTGSVYTRWGRTSCPSNGTDLVYKGNVVFILVFN